MLVVCWLFGIDGNVVVSIVVAYVLNIFQHAVGAYRCCVTLGGIRRRLIERGRKLVGGISVQQMGCTDCCVPKVDMPVERKTTTTPV